MRHFSALLVWGSCLLSLTGSWQVSASVPSSCLRPSCSSSVSSSSGACTTTYDVARQCLLSLPFNLTTAQNTLDVLLQSIDNYSLRDITHASGPPYNVHTDIVALLDNIQTLLPVYTSDFAFQEAVQTALASMHDAHTRWGKPVCYDAVLTMPFVFHTLLNQTQATTTGTTAAKLVYTLQPSIYLSAYLQQFPSQSAAVGRLLSSSSVTQVVGINGVDTTTALADWANTYETRSNDAAILFNTAIRTFLWRSQRATVLPAQDGLTLTVIEGSGPVTIDSPNTWTITLPWLVSFSANFADVDTCLATPPAPLSSSSSSPSPMQTVGRFAEFHEPAPTPVHDILFTNYPRSTPSSSSSSSSSTRTVIIGPGASNSTISCFVQNTDSDSVLIMKVGSFFPAGFYRDSWYHFIGDAVTCLQGGPSNLSYSALVLDVMQNGGGYVCLGLRLLKLLFADLYEQPSRVLYTYDLPHSTFMDGYIERFNHNNPYVNPQDVEEILNPATLQPFADGRSYYYPGHNRTLGGVTRMFSNPFVLDCREADAMFSDFRPPSQLNNRQQTAGDSRSRVTILTDGTCGSTCATFTKVAQEQGVATFVGLGGLWDGPTPHVMDVSSFAGGFVCNAGYLGVMAKLSQSAPFPQFLTSVTFQFTWSVWYSQKQPDRPIQFTQQAADLRVAFFDFPHTSVPANTSTQQLSDLYDASATDLLNRIRVTQQTTTTDDVNKWRSALIAVAVVSGILVLVLLWWGCRLRRKLADTAVINDYAPANM